MNVITQLKLKPPCDRNITSQNLENICILAIPFSNPAKHENRNSRETKPPRSSISSETKPNFKKDILLLIKSAKLNK